MIFARSVPLYGFFYNSSNIFNIIMVNKNIIDLLTIVKKYHNINTNKYLKAVIKRSKE